MPLSDKAQKTRERILLAASELFYLHGYNATGLDKVISAAGVSKGNFYYYFKSKESLGVETLDWHASEVMGNIQKNILSNAKPPLQHLFEILAFLSNMQKEQQNEGHICGCYFGNFTLELSTASQAIRDKVKHIFKQYMLMIESLLEQAKQNGELSSNIDPAKMSSIILSQMEGAILLDKANQESRFVDRSIDFIKHHLKGS